MAQEPYSALTLRPSAPAPADYFPCNNTTAPGGVTTIRQSIQGLFTSPTIQSPTVTGGVAVTGDSSVIGQLVVDGILAGFSAAFSMGGVVFSGDGTATPGRILAQIANGVVVACLSGETNDFNLVTPGLQSILRVPTGTTNVVLGGSVTVGSVRQTQGVTTSVPVSTQTTIATADNAGPLVTTVMGSDGTGNEFVDQIAWSSSGFSSPVFLSTANVRFNAGGAYGRGYIASGNTLQLITSPFGTATLTVTVKASSLESV